MNEVTQPSRYLPPGLGVGDGEDVPRAPEEGPSDAELPARDLDAGGSVDGLWRRERGIGRSVCRVMGILWTRTNDRNRFCSTLIVDSDANKWSH